MGDAGALVVEHGALLEGADLARVDEVGQRLIVQEVEGVELGEKGGQLGSLMRHLARLARSFQGDAPLVRSRNDWTPIR